MAPDYLAVLRTEGAALAAAARSGPLDATVASCPGWDVAALVAHTSRIHHWATQAIRGAGQPPGEPPTPPDDVLGWLDDGLTDLLAALEVTADDAVAWTFAQAAGSVGFWRRRMAQETAVHRWDVEAARGVPAPIDPAVAADGIDEVLDIFAPRRLRSRPGGLDTGGTIHLHCTDVEGEWTFQALGDRFELTRGHAKGDVAVRGRAEALLLLLWGRRTPITAGVELFGDPAVLDRWLAVGMP